MLTRRPLLAAALAAVWLVSAAPPSFARDRADALPRSGAKVRFAEGGHARIPFVFASQHVWVRGTIGRSDSLWIVIDTGASTTSLDDSLAHALHRKVHRVHEAFGAAGSQTAATVSGVRIDLPGLSIRKRRVQSLALGSFSALTGGRPMQVILGYELFRDCVVRFDYPNGVMDVWDPKHAPPVDSGGTVLPMTLTDNHPFVEGELAIPGRAPLRGRYVIDTGSSMGVTLAPDIVERDSLAAAFPRTIEVLGLAVGGAVHYRLGRADSFRLGELTFARPIAGLAPPGAGHITSTGTIGNIGGGVLGRCRVTFDYPHRLVRFEPGANFSASFEVDMSGATFQRSGPVLVVRFVNTDTPATEAGLQVGDRVLSIDGTPVIEIEPTALRQRMQKEGHTVKLEVERGDQRFTANLTLRRLI